MNTVEHPKKGHSGNDTFVLFSEVVLLSEVPAQYFNYITLQANGVEYK